MKEKEIYIIKEKLLEFVDIKNETLTVSKKIGKRNEFIFMIGEMKFSEKIKIYENDEIVIFAQDLKDEIKNKIIKFLR